MVLRVVRRSATGLRSTQWSTAERKEQGSFQHKSLGDEGEGNEM